MTRMPSRSGIVATVVVAALALAACGSDPDSAASAAPTAPTAGAATHESSEHTTAPATDRIDPVMFHQEMRKLWEDHITWTRLYIVSAVAELPDLEATAGRLLQNQADIGAAVATFYGDDAGACPAAAASRRAGSSEWRSRSAGSTLRGIVSWRAANRSRLNRSNR